MSEERPWSARRLHFVGIGGAGMSGLALVAAQLGAGVTGSDRAECSTGLSAHLWRTEGLTNRTNVLSFANGQWVA